jgi:hypothetical protein
MNDKEYYGYRHRYGPLVMVRQGSIVRHLPWRVDVLCRSASGFDWGYGGPCSQQLAIALLCDLGLSRSDVLAMYRALAKDYVSKLNWIGWEATEADLWAQVAKIRSSDHGTS